ncbi:MAG: hypothetical protein Salg2KO_20210 [Salibacteraceae bacterium]
MSDTFEFRPRYKFHSDLTIEEVSTRILDHSPSTESHIGVKTVQGHLVLKFTADVSHFWTPHMDVNLEIDPDHEDKKVLVRCLIAPAPTVWTMFMFAYGLFGFACFVGLTLSMSQWTLEKPIWGFWILLAGLIGIGLMYFTSYEGKKLSRNEMIQLKQFVDDALGCDCIALAEKQRFV